ncbi:hypothetical protein [Liquorilactobacillus nagelii]|uniref:Flagellar protein FliT n=1 Tax=Liquorilactobacillus nagelii TaxID=82688 RepID=A0A0A7RFU5_9LACO|nr:hypothetical protein [Liquorilactobacillus nagelii]AJA34122.1 hypothetical protein [Liquorilactobacillus nagelii]KRL42107.1 hypothetical protein FD45_GL000341 [Liquorilactobacillus nagelii DSM 13675]QYH55078.1 hypothetical protein G6O73_10660 [Liquorilactobacillus nagelii DSM 13675]
MDNYYQEKLNRQRVVILKAILQCLQDWDETLPQAELIFKKNKQHIADLEKLGFSLNKLDQSDRKLVNEIVTEYQQILTKIRQDKAEVKRQVLELTYSRGALKAYLDRDRRRSLIDFDF